MNSYQAETEEKIDKLEDRVQLKIKEEINRLETLAKEA
jgi:hypothetical protein